MFKKSKCNSAKLRKAMLLTVKRIFPKNSSVHKDFFPIVIPFDIATQFS